MSSTKKLVFFDTETSSLFKRSQDILQFAAIETSLELNISGIVNEYFVSSSTIPSSSILIHKIDNRRARELTRYTFFENFVKDTNIFDSPRVFIAHNASFDISAINAVLETNGYDAIDFGPSVKSLEDATLVEGNCVLDSMPYFKNILPDSKNSSLKLEILANKYKVSSDRYKMPLHTFMESRNIPIYNLTFHNALYDSWILYLLFYIHKHRLL